MFFTGDDSVEFFVNLPVPCINAAITDHFVMLFRNMADEAFNEFHNRKCFFHIVIIFVPVIMERDKVTMYWSIREVAVAGRRSSQISFRLLTSDRDRGCPFGGSASEKGGAEINNSPAMSTKGRVWPSGKVRSLSAAFTNSHHMWQTIPDCHI